MFFDYRSDCVMNTMELWTTYLVSRIQVADVDALGAAIHWRYYGKFRCINIGTRHIDYSALMCNIWKQNITLTSHLKHFFKQCPALAHKNVCMGCSTEMLPHEFFKVFNWNTFIYFWNTVVGKLQSVNTNCLTKPSAQTRKKSNISIQYKCR